VRARLGRPAQDMLEAAVVLEAWTGAPPGRALADGRRLMSGRPALPEVSVSAPPAAAKPRRKALEAAAFGVAVVAVAAWARPLRDLIGASGLRDALRVALPLTLAVQWTLSSRYLSRPGGVATLAARPALLAAGAAGLLIPAIAGAGAVGAVAALLTLLWCGGAIAARRGRPMGFAAAVALATPPLLAGASPWLVLSALVLAVAALAFAAPGPRCLHPGRWDRALLAGLIGAALGVLLVGDASLPWVATPGEALLLAPSILATVYGGGALWRLPAALSGALVGVRLHERPGRAPTRLLLGALGRTVAISLALSLLCRELVPWPSSPVAREAALCGFALLGLVTLLASLLEALDRGGRVVLVLGCGVALELLIRPPFPGAALIAGAATCTLLLIAAAVAAVARPATAVATHLWIG